MSEDTIRPELRWAIAAAQEKKADELTLLDLTGLGAFTEFFLLCTGHSTPQITAICDAIEEQLKKHGIHPQHREGRAGAEWLLLDYGRFVVHVLSDKLREYYDLERLWRNARRIDFGDSDSHPGVSAAGGSL